MSSAIHPAFAASGVPSRHPISHGSAPIPVPSVPAGTFASGTKVQVGSHRVIIEKYLSEGGFAHVYLVRLPKPIDGNDEAVLKRVAVPDKEALANMRTEVETMKKLKGHRHIVTYIDSHASQLKGGGYEVFLLMEYCAGGGLIDFMNTRLKNRLTEPEILKIFSDVAQGVACMHYLKPPLLHRDLKVENILISACGSAREYKLCDFGSTAPPRPAATTAAEGRLIEDDVQKHTTLQYRSPEMIDVYRKQPIDEKSDIWALGVLLYKLCYYTTPFEEQGQMAILNASFKFPGYPTFSDNVKKLTASMLRENPRSRPNIYQVVREVCLLRGTEIPIKDIYTGRPVSEARRNQQLPTPPSEIKSPPSVGAYRADPVEDKTTIPEITPMRRGRPVSSTTEGVAHKPRPSPSPMRVIASDPFTALDSNPESSPDPALDEISSRFPPLDQFSILHDAGNNFAFDPKPQPASNKPKDISQRVTEALADDAFALPKVSHTKTLTHSKSVPGNGSNGTFSTSNAKMELDGTSRSSSVQNPQSQRTKMVSTGTMTSPLPPSPEKSVPSDSSRPIFRFPPPTDHRSSSQPRANDRSSASETFEQRISLPQSPEPLNHRKRPQSATLSVSKLSASSRPSLEGQRPAPGDFTVALDRSRSTSSRIRPSSVNVASSTPFMRNRSSSRDRELANTWNSPKNASERHTLDGSLNSDDGAEHTTISSNVEFLKAMEEEEPSRRKEKRSSSGSKHAKRASLPSISLSGTKSLLAGRFGEAFRRFETNTSSGQRDASPPLDRGGSELTPIAGSEATDDDGHVVEEAEDAPPEVRRELERRRLSQEERRVADAAAAYRQRLAQRDNEGGKSRGGESNRAALIQNKVQALLDETSKTSPTKTAAGYGRFTDAPTSLQSRKPEPAASIPTAGGQTDLPPTRTTGLPSNTASAPSHEKPILRPTAPPKPQALRTGGRGEPEKAPFPVTTSSVRAAETRSETGPREDWETNFSKKYPSLSGLELVETEIDKAGSVSVSTREV